MFSFQSSIDKKLDISGFEKEINHKNDNVVKINKVQTWIILKVVFLVFICIKLDFKVIILEILKILVSNPSVPSLRWGSPSFRHLLA
jgi:hypothetical protein